MEKIVFEISRAEIEDKIGKHLSDEDWSVVKDEAEDCLDYYFFDELPRIINELAS